MIAIFAVIGMALCEERTLQAESVEPIETPMLFAWSSIDRALLRDNASASATVMRSGTSIPLLYTFNLFDDKVTTPNHVLTGIFVDLWAKTDEPGIFFFCLQLHPDNLTACQEVCK